MRSAAKAARLSSDAMSESSSAPPPYRHAGPGTLWGWGRLALPGREDRSEDLESLTRNAALSRGLGRAYGDSALPARPDERVANTTLANRLLSFDETTGFVRAESGLSLVELHRLVIPRGFFSPITPGTQFVTLGGMVAADVHGKNHHRSGCFGEFVTKLLVRVADGRLIECSRDVEPELFRATIGGMGLTGHILEVEFRLERIPSPWIYEERIKVPDIDAFIDALKDAGPKWPMTVGWIDCLTRGRGMGRGILFRGRWAEAHEAPRRPPRPLPVLNVPFELPSFLAGRAAVQAFNFGLYTSQPKEKKHLVGWEQYFYPLDFIRNWNRGYGRQGLTQYQCVLPEAAGRGAARRFLDVLTKRGGASFLCVIKDCGPEGTGMLSFPMPGISVALDIAVRPDTQELIDELNAFVIREGGRIYLAKDAFTKAEDFRRMEKRLDAFLRVKKKWDPEGRIRSAQSVRLFGSAKGDV